MTQAHSQREEVGGGLESPIKFDPRTRDCVVINFVGTDKSAISIFNYCFTCLLAFCVILH